ncbi:Acetyltransferase (GNAT) domain-containing protein [Flagellimonas taeanensis]|uniref:Acetyltransferase (GNAT) domain-containing protein n=2 Tax=Flagellimonas taeanensis TaxID=1005926 RepID=A0A1M6V0Y4_9FLAO|nr:Acetyltransferase (GNAT) domain-containing protein [Allomuricauda taeanensis]SHK75061.1 Acetyltransferase (GNAT) domain-containing protein [Allomuricauda taeanensis]
MESMGSKTIIFLKQLASMGSFPACISKIRDTRTGEVLFEQSVEKRPMDNRGAMILRDVPSYLEIEWDETKIKTQILATQKTYVVDLDHYRDSDAYLQKHFGPKSRSALRRYKKRLEQCFRIEYWVHYGAMDKIGYDVLFEQIRDLMERRFEQKKERNYELQHLEEIKNDVYPKLLEKQASIFVITANGRPISIRINLMRGTLAYYILSVYDPDYDIFRLGKLDMWQNIHWFLENGYKKYDLLKGYAYIKERWADSIYDNNLILVNRDASLKGRMGLLLCYWRKKALLALVRAAKSLGLDRAIRKMGRQLAPKWGMGPPEIWPISCTNQQADLFDALPDWHSQEKKLNRLLFNLAYKHSFPINNIKVSIKKDDPRQFLIKIGDTCYLFTFDKNNPIR